MSRLAELLSPRCARKQAKCLIILEYMGCFRLAEPCGGSSEFEQCNRFSRLR